MKDFTPFNGLPFSQIWNELGNINIDENECIEQPFYEYEKGTEIYEIWQDIEDIYNVSIGDIMNNENQ